MSDIRSYKAIAESVASVVESKQSAYGNSFGQADKVFNLLYPNGIHAEQMKDALTLVRILDKMFRIATQKDAYGENPYMDIAGYCLLAVKRREDEEAANLMNFGSRCIK